jgi:hypothetical protein
MLGLAGALGAAAVLAWLALDVNLRRACTLGDTPDLPLCPAVAQAPDTDAARLRERIARNPGDTAAYVQLALREAPAGRTQALAAAARLAPSHPQVLLLRAAEALDRQDWNGAAGLLVTLAEHHRNGNAARALALLAGAGQGQALLAHVTPGSRWVREVLAQLPEAKVPFSAVLPLVVQGWRQGVLDDATLRSYVRELKAAGAWNDAYGLWLAMHGNAAPLLFNGGFDQPFEADGFDWEVSPQPPARAGMLLSQPGAGERGGVLELRFTGRPLPVPLLRQYLLLGEGRYRLRGEYRAQQLRMEQGLAWVVQCAAPGVAPLRSSPLVPRGAGWQPFEFEFRLPRGCGTVASLQLEPHAAFEAKTGARGAVAFDGLALKQLP